MSLFSQLCLTLILSHFLLKSDCLSYEPRPRSVDGGRALPSHTLNSPAGGDSVDSGGLNGVSINPVLSQAQSQIAGSTVFSCPSGTQPMELTAPGSIVSHNGFLAENTEYYPANQNCIWKINAPENFVIKLTFQVFELEYDPRCGYDYVNIYDGPNMQPSFLAEVFCGAKSDPFTSSGNNAILYFHSDWFVSGAGFKATYFFEHANASAECGIHMTNESGTIISHVNHGTEQYPNDWKCRWNITMPGNNRRIRIAFDEFNLEKHNQCEFDYLKVFDGANEEAAVLGTFCGDELPDPLVSSTNNLLLVFSSDAAVKGDGFRLSWNPYSETLNESIVSQCGLPIILRNPSGYIVSKNFIAGQDYANNLACQWLIQIPGSHRIKLVIERIDIEVHATCDYDYLQLFDGGSTSAPNLGRFCGSTSSPTPIFSSWNTMLITFKTDVGVTGRGFKLYYEAVLASSLPVPSSPVVGAGSTTTAHNLPSQTVMQSRCGGPMTLTARTGTILSADFNSARIGSSYPKSLECEWLILAPNNTYITLIFNIFQLEPTMPECKFDYLELFDGFDRTAPVLVRLCDEKPFERYTTRNRVLYLQFRSDSHLERRGFNITYLMHPPTAVVTNIPRPQVSPTSPYDSGCGGPRQLNTPEGIITSHLRFSVEKSYNKNSDCKWIVGSPLGNPVWLYFDTFALEGSVPECKYDKLVIYRGNQPIASNKLVTYCDSLSGRNFTTNERQLFIHFTSDDTVENRGFKIVYRILQSPTRTTPYPIVIPSSSISPTSDSGCGGWRLRVAPNGTLTSKDYPSNYASHLRCEWLIKAQPDQRIRLSFFDFDIEEPDPENKLCYDALTVYDGNTTAANVLAKKCGRSRPLPIRSTGASMLIVFETDAEVNGRGFKLDYMAQGLDKCNSQGLVLQKYPGTIHSPNFFENYYLPDLLCKWWIIAPPNHYISITFNTIDIEPPSDDGRCSYDYVEIKESVNKSDINRNQKKIGRYCGNISPRRIFSKETSVLVTFRSDMSLQRHGFYLTYDVKVLCGEDEFTCEDGSCLKKSFKCNPAKNCSDESDEAGCTLNDNRCGQPTHPPKLFQRKIVGGTRANKHSWPWQVQLKFNGGHYCGAAIIDRWWIISAAHCFDEGKGEILSKWKVKAGKHRKVLPETSEQTKGIKKVVTHPNYSKVGNNHDIALVMLDSPLNFTDKVLHACLPSTHVGKGHQCFATGWGATENTGNSLILRQVMLPVIEGELCDNLGITSQMFCAGHSEGGKDTCQGDSGGPLVCRRPDNKWYQQGITSWGIGCADPNSPGVYTKIPVLLKWVYEQLGIDENTDQAQY